MKKGNHTLNTPNISKMFESEGAQYERERMKHDEKHLGDDWENQDVEECTKCAGTGKLQLADGKFENCPGCEGTGTWFILYYGISDGTPYAYTDEWGIGFLKETCKTYREAHREMQLLGKTYTNLRPYLLPKTLEMELLARGYDPHTKSDEEKIRIANVVAREFPDFMCVNYTNF